MTQFKYSPDELKNSEAALALVVLNNARKVAGSFLTQFSVSRKSSGRGATTDNQQDLLRAMFAFSSAGLDAMVKQLIRDALPKVVDTDPGSHLKFINFVEQRLKREGQAFPFIAKIIADKNPRGQLIDEWINHLVSGSMQSFEQISLAAAAFDIPTREIVANEKMVKSAFMMRNEIVHEMDVNFSSRNRARRQRKQKEMIEATNVLFEVSKKFLSQVDKKLTVNNS